jgi:hypothetical protein
MERSAGTRCLRATASALLIALVCTSFAHAQELVYADDFSTDRAMADSYEHSDFIENLPGPWPVAGFLMYEWNGGDRMLTFYYGTGDDLVVTLDSETPAHSGSWAAIKWLYEGPADQRVAPG